MLFMAQHYFEKAPNCNEQFEYSKGMNRMRTRVYPNNVRDLASLANAASRNFGRFGYPYDYAANGGSNGESKYRLPVDVWATDNAYHIAAYLPGVDPEAVEITFEGESLTIRGEMPAVDEETKFVRRELFHGSFERTLNFNVPVNSDAIEATFKHGVLTLDVPKAEEILPKQIKIQVA
jgi:HSP20 family protein